jgi:hypothetical protein
MLYKPSVNGALALAAAGGNIQQAMSRDELASKIALQAGKRVSKALVIDFLDKAGNTINDQMEWARSKNLSPEQLQRIIMAADSLTGQSAENVRTMFGPAAVSAMAKRSAEAATRAGVEGILSRTDGPALGTLIRDAMNKSFTGEPITGAESIIGKEAYDKLGNRRKEADELALAIGETISGFQQSGVVPTEKVNDLERKIGLFNDITAQQEKAMQKQARENALNKEQPVVFNISAQNAENNQVLLNLGGVMRTGGSPAV